jgi:hypothetical protein
MINKIIPADDLHWNEEDNKYVSLSNEDVDNIIVACAKQDITEFEDIYKVVQWAGLVKVGEILLRNFLDGRIKILGFDKSEPYFGENK